MIFLSPYIADFVFLLHFSAKILSNSSSIAKSTLIDMQTEIFHFEKIFSNFFSEVQHRTFFENCVFPTHTNDMSVHAVFDRDLQ